MGFRSFAQRATLRRDALERPQRRGTLQRRPVPSLILQRLDASLTDAAHLGSLAVHQGLHHGRPERRSNTRIAERPLVWSRSGAAARHAGTPRVRSRTEMARLTPTNTHDFKARFACSSLVSGSATPFRRQPGPDWRSRVRISAPRSRALTTGAGVPGGHGGVAVGLAGEGPAWLQSRCRREGAGSQSAERTARIRPRDGRGGRRATYLGRHSEGANFVAYCERAPKW